MALVVKRTAAAGGVDATQTTAQGIWNQIDALLIAAGWTVLYDYSANVIAYAANTAFTVGQIVERNSFRWQCITSGTTGNTVSLNNPALTSADGTSVWTFLSSAGASDKVYFSNGESGTESLFLRVSYSTHSGQNINMKHFQYFSAGTAFGYNPQYPAAASNDFTQFTYTNAVVVNYVMVADKDSFIAITVDAANVRRLMAMGKLQRMPGTISTSFISDNSVTAGLNATFTFSSGDPVASGYKVGDRVFVVSQQANSGSPYDQTIPLYAAIITAVTSTSITIDNAQASTSAGALIGADPQPRFMFDNTMSTQDPLSQANTVYVGYVFNNQVSNLFTVGTANKGFGNLVTGGGLITQAAAELDPNNRTGRVRIGEITFVNADEPSGVIPKLYSNPKTTDTLWAIARTTKETSNFDYVSFPTVPPATGRWDLVGPIASSGAATYTCDIYRVDSDTWLESEIAYTQTDKTGTNAVIIPVGTEITQDDWVEASLQVFLPNTDKPGTAAIAIPVGENNPQDINPTTSGGGNGFNSGFN
jgi:hypothetical protein